MLFPEPLAPKARIITSFLIFVKSFTEMKRFQSNMNDNTKFHTLKKIFYTVFCPVGLRKIYCRTFNFKLRIEDTKQPLEPHPTFLGIKLDPKLDF